MRSLFPEEFRNLPRDCLERMWDAFFSESDGIYISREQFPRVFGVSDREVKLFNDSHKTEEIHHSEALQKLHLLYELPSCPGWVDGIEVFAAIILNTNQLSRREKLLMIRDRCMVYSVLNLASAVNGASISLENRRQFETEEEKLRCKESDLLALTDKFPHRKIDIRVQILKTGPDVLEKNLKLAVNGTLLSFSDDGVVEFQAESNSDAMIGSWKIKLKTNPCLKLRGRTEFEEAEVKIVELDGLNEKGDADDDLSEDEEDREFKAIAEKKKATGKDGDRLAHSGNALETLYSRFTLEPSSSQVHYELVCSYGLDNTVGAKQIATGEIVYAAGRFVVVEDLLLVKRPGTKRVFPFHSSRVCSVEVHPNGRWIFSKELNSSKILAWDAQKMQLLGCIDSIVTGECKLAVSKCGNTLFLYCFKDEPLFAFYDISRLDNITLIQASSLPEDEDGIDVRKVDMLSKDEAVLAGTNVLRVSSSGRVERMRWGKTAPKALQDSLTIVLGSRACVTASSQNGTVYLWLNDICVKHITFDKNLSVHSLSVNGQSSIACGLSDGSIRLLTARSLEPAAGPEAQAASLVEAEADSLTDSHPGKRQALVSLFYGLSGLLVHSANGSLFWYAFKAQGRERWSLLKVGHGGTGTLKWCWCGSSMLATAGDDQQLRVWRLCEEGENEKQNEEEPAMQEKMSVHELKAKYNLLTSRTKIASGITAIAGDKSRVFIALEERTIQVIDIHAPNSSSYDLISTSLPRIDQLAVTDNLIAACCEKAKAIEVRAFPSGKLVTKLSFDPSSILLKNTLLHFASREIGENQLCFGDYFAWDIKSWTKLDPQSIKSTASQDPPDTLPSACSSALLLLRRTNGMVEVKNNYRKQTQDLQAMSTVCVLPKKSSLGNYTIVSCCEDSVWATAVHPDWNKGVYALATEYNFVQVQKYRLKVVGRAHRLAFDGTNLLAVATSARLYLFNWELGVLLASVPLVPSCNTTKALAIHTVAATKSGEGVSTILIARVNGFGDIEVFKYLPGTDNLVWEPSYSVLDCQATCLTASGYYGTKGGSFGNWVSGRRQVADHGGPVLDIFEDRNGILSSSSDGTVKAWTGAMQQVPLRKDDSIKYDSGIVSLARVPTSNEFVFRTEDDRVYLQHKLLPALQTNTDLVHAKPSHFSFSEGHVPPPAPPVPSLEDPVTDDEADARIWINLRGEKVFVYNNFTVLQDDPTRRFTFDDRAKMSTMSEDRKVLAVVSVNNDLYILDAGTLLLVYFVPASVVGCNVERIQFYAEFKRDEAASTAAGEFSGVLGGSTAPFALNRGGLFEDLYVNGLVFPYCTS